MVYIYKPNLYLHLLHYLSFLLRDIMRGRLLLFGSVTFLPTTPNYQLRISAHEYLQVPTCGYNVVFAHASNCMCETVCSVLLYKVQRSCSKH